MAEAAKEPLDIARLAVGHVDRKPPARGAFAGSAPERVESFDCAGALRSFDQTLVQCDQRGSKQAVSFVYRSVAMSP